MFNDMDMLVNDFMDACDSMIAWAWESVEEDKENDSH